MKPLWLPASCGLLAAMFFIGGAFFYVALAFVIVLACGIDRLSDEEPRSEPEPGLPVRLSELPLYCVPVLTLATTVFFCLHVGGMPPAALFGWGHALQAGSGPAAAPNGLELIFAIISLAMIYGTAVAVVSHELIHRLDNRLQYALGQGMLAFVADTPDAVEHVFGHHLTVATPADPAWPRRGQSFWSFMPAAALGTLVSAWRLEADRLKAAGHPSRWSIRNRIIQGAIIQLVLLAGAALIGGLAALLAVLVAVAVARVIVDATKYISHYGLIRLPGAPIEARHSWSSGRQIAAGLMLNSALHADHHMHPERPYWELRLSQQSPVVPCSAGVMIFFALVPPLWFRVMEPELEKWDRHHASNEERILLAGMPCGRPAGS